MFIWTPCNRLSLNIFPDFEVLTPFFFFFFSLQPCQQTWVRIKILLCAVLHKHVARSSCCPKEFHNQHNEGRQHSGMEAGKWRQRNLSKVKVGMKSRFPVSLSRAWLMTGSGFPTLTPSSAFSSWVDFSSGLPSHFTPPFGEPPPSPSDLRGDG